MDKDAFDEIVGIVDGYPDKMFDEISLPNRIQSLSRNQSNVPPEKNIVEN